MVPTTVNAAKAFGEGNRNRPRDQLSASNTTATNIVGTAFTHETRNGSLPAADLRQTFDALYATLEKMLQIVPKTSGSSPKGA